MSCKTRPNRAWSGISQCSLLSTESSIQGKKNHRIPIIWLRKYQQGDEKLSDMKSRAFACPVLSDSDEFHCFSHLRCGCCHTNRNTEWLRLEGTSGDHGNWEQFLKTGRKRVPLLSLGRSRRKIWGTTGQTALPQLILEIISRPVKDEKVIMSSQHRFMKEKLRLADPSLLQ